MCCISFNYSSLHRFRQELLGSYMVNVGSKGPVPSRSSAARIFTNIRSSPGAIGTVIAFRLEPCRPASAHTKTDLTSLIRFVSMDQMSKVYSTYEAKAKFSEILRRVRAGGTVRISCHGEAVAEVRPVSPPRSLGVSLRRMEEEGVVVRASSSTPCSAARHKS